MSGSCTVVALEQGYTVEVKARHILAMAFVFLLAACTSKPPQNKEAIKQAVLEHLQKGANLDPSSMDIEVATVSFGDKQAKATVMFRPKSNPEQGMSINYTLDAQGKKWVVAKKEGSGGAGGGANPHGGGMAPQGGATAPGEALPPGHPPVSEPSGEKPKPGTR